VCDPPRSAGRQPCGPVKAWPAEGAEVAAEAGDAATRAWAAAAPPARRVEAIAQRTAMYTLATLDAAAWPADTLAERLVVALPIARRTTGRLVKAQ
jgi:hypothetical protein